MSEVIACLPPIAEAPPAAIGGNATRDTLAVLVQHLVDIKALLAKRAKAPIEPELVDRHGAAALTSMSASAWDRLVAARKAPSGIKLGGLRRWRVEELRAFVAAECDMARYEAHRRRNAWVNPSFA